MQAVYLIEIPARQLLPPLLISPESGGSLEIQRGNLISSLPAWTGHRNFPGSPDVLLQYTVPGRVLE